MTTSGKPRRRQRHVFRVMHQEKQRILLRALEALPDANETPAESAAIAEMLSDLERMLRRRVRRRWLAKKDAGASAGPGTSGSALS